METHVKYFIQDTDTGLWYTSPPHPYIHSSKWGWDIPFPKASDYWTSNPNKAFGWFKDRTDAEVFLKERLDAHIEDKIGNYLILDDDSDMLEDQKENHFIQTDSMEGLLFADMRKIKDFFKIERYPKDIIEWHQCKEMFASYHFKNETP